MTAPGSVNMTDKLISRRGGKRLEENMTTVQASKKIWRKVNMMWTGGEGEYDEQKNKHEGINQKELCTEDEEEDENNEEMSF